MPLVNCKECKAEISDKADKCPQCGAKSEKSHPFLLLIIGAIIIALIIKALPSNQINSSSSNTSPAEVVMPNSWQYRSSVDTVSNKAIQHAELVSNNTTELAFPYQGGTSASLGIRYHPRYDKDIIFFVNKGHLHCQYDNCYVSIRFDDGDVTEYKVGEPSDRNNQSYFILNFNKALNQIKKSKKMYIEVQFYRQGNRTFEFNTDNLDTVKLALVK